jgi:hypothetical protein
MKKPTKYQYIGERLRNLGLGTITLERFWHEMEKQRFTSDDIDKWCAEHWQRDEDAEMERRERVEARRSSRW